MIALSLYTWQVIALIIFLISLINGAAVMAKLERKDAPIWFVVACWLFWAFLVVVGWSVYFNAGTYSEIFK